MSYTQLTPEHRYQIDALQKAGFNQTQLATESGVHKATVSRERQRNSGQRGYRPKQAQELAAARLGQRVRPRIQPQTWQPVTDLLSQQWSPAQLRGRLRLEPQPTVSHARIYQDIYSDKRAGGTLHRNLRLQKARRKRDGSSARRGPLPARRSIDERPKIVESKARRGAWEADTIIGRKHQQAIVSLVDRKSQLVRLAKVERNTAESVANAMTTQLASLTVKTIPSGNGREFARHQEVAAQLAADFFFAHPYCPWERGLNENTTGLVRQYFPKQSEFSKSTDSQLNQVVERLNQRPRKTLGYKTPNEVFFKLLLVALTT